MENIVVCPSGIVINMTYFISITDNNGVVGEYKLAMAGADVAIINATDKEFIESKLSA
jgi:hypothetical protein